MHAWQFDSPATGLECVEYQAPALGPGQVLIDVEAAGMCQSDVHIINGHGNAWLRKRPIILGHEVAGTVRTPGPGVTDLAVGERVAVALIAHPIELADFANGIGLGFDGGYAPQAVVPRATLVAIPEGVPFTLAAVATDSIATAYHAVVAESGTGPGSTLVVVGVGGLGLNAVQIAKHRGTTVYGVDIDPGALETARAHGAADCFPDISDVPDAVDAVIDFAGMGTTTADALAAVKPGGRVVVVGLGSPEATIPTHLLVTHNISLRGSLGASLEDLEAVLGLIAAGELTPVIEEVPFADVPVALKRLEAGQVRGRLVTRPRV
ncbi:Zn-dependent alcohol dehydrogenase [Mycolicibacterium flavescens]|uniref:zinc-binding dehydrogenase n=1 Tax=Mycobacterium neumannii TaxID=2048551 RepID=UPI000B940746|nr:zinc-binding dehydrogenase [Mycobacterium neumannii]VEG47112.1 Zn-dependent alcohol dehydrogenase [Mycolicibacterium flavescens]